jgi:hypothetical protein
MVPLRPARSTCATPGVRKQTNSGSVTAMKEIEKGRGTRIFDLDTILLDT